jgi:Glyoxalase/Bleomycin resistance protein/Dioxygenase superfamily
VTAPILQSLDFVYMPSADPAAEMAWFERSLGAEIVFAIERFGTRVAMLELGAGSPPLLLAAHLEGERPVLVYRVADLEAAAAALRERGCEVSEEFGIPPGPIRAIEAPGGHRLAIYEETRPDRLGSISGRRDF